MTRGHVLITGAAGGIGRAMAEAFLAAGWRVTGFDRRAADVPWCAPVDITDEAALDAAMDRAWSRGRVDAVFANAAVTDNDHRPVVDLDYDAWRRIMRVNLDGSFLTARAAARRMIGAGGGNIVFVTSSLAFLANAKTQDGPYCASKSAVEMLMRVLALELREHGINVNSLFPSVKVDTGFFAHLPAGERATLAQPGILNEPALFLAGLSQGSLTGVSLDQQRWDDDADYRTAITEGRDDGQAHVS